MTEDDKKRLRVDAEQWLLERGVAASELDMETLNHELMVHQIELSMQNDELIREKNRVDSLSQQLHSVLNQSPIAYAIVNSRGVIKECNETLARWVDIDCQALIDRYIFTLFSDDSQHQLRSVFRKMFDRPGSCEIELRFDPADNVSESRIALLQSAPLHLFGRDEDDALVVLSFSDISQHIRVRSTMDLASHVLKNTSECVIITDAHARIIDVNPAFCQTTGYSPAEVIGKRPNILASGKHKKRFYEEMWSALNKDGHWRGRIVNRRKSGDEYVEELAIHTVFEYGKPVYYIGIFYDVSEQMLAEEALRRAQRLESVGTLAAGIAHNFNNMLAGINGNIYLAMRDKSMDGKTLARLKTIEKIAGDAADMVRQLLSFARQSEKRELELNLCEFLREFQVKHKHHIPEHISFQVECGDINARIYCDVLQLEQLLLNLVINASHALEGVANPRIMVSLANCRDESEVDGFVLISVQDNGCGIPEEIRSKIFEPFFTTKESGLGTGLGLSTAYGSITSMGGYIDLQSTVGKGTTFHIYLPLYQGNSEDDAPASEDVSAAPITSDEYQLLIVDDNREVREITAEILKSEGYQVITASDGEEALKYVLAPDSQISLVLTDSIMPRMNGIDLAKRIRVQKKHLPIVIMSGYSKDIIKGKFDEEGVLFLHKPFSPEQIFAVVSRLLHQRH